MSSMAPPAPPVRLRLEPWGAFALEFRPRVRGDAEVGTKATMRCWDCDEPLACELVAREQPGGGETWEVKRCECRGKLS